MSSPVMPFSRHPFSCYLVMDSLNTPHGGRWENSTDSHVETSQIDPE